LSQRTGNQAQSKEWYDEDPEHGTLSFLHHVESLVGLPQNCYLRTPLDISISHASVKILSNLF
jgi:hypothetical protein